jgi:hypothetical protein
MSTPVSSPAPSGLPEPLADHHLLTSDEAALLLGVPVATLRARGDPAAAATGREQFRSATSTTPLRLA